MKRKLLIAGTVIGVALALGPFLGIMGATFNMFRSIGESAAADAKSMSSGIGAVLYYRKIGLLVCPVGLGLFFFCVIKLNALRSQPPPLPPP